MIQQPVLEELLEREEPFTGLVVSIGINDSDSSMWHSQGLMQSVGNYIAGLLQENEFSCRTAYDEFVMVCRGEQGAQSQRRLESHFRAPVGLPTARHRRLLHSIQLGRGASSRSTVGRGSRFRHRTHARNQAERTFRQSRSGASTACLTRLPSSGYSRSRQTFSAASGVFLLALEHARPRCASALS